MAMATAGRRVQGSFSLSTDQLPHRRRNLLTGEWVLVSPQRMQRPWQGEVKQGEAPPAHIDLAQKEVQEVQISSRKITGHFARIEGVELDGIEAAPAIAAVHFYL